MTLTVADTAFSIAAVRAEESSLAHPLFEDPYAHLFRAAGAHAEEGTQRYLSLPFFREGVRLRTRYLDDAVRAAFDQGIDPLVVLGAGFDMRGMRLSETHRTFEIDVASQMDRKRSILESAGIAIPSRISYIGFDFDRADFDSGLERALRDAGFRVGAGAVFVWEGVIGYIDRAMIDRSLRFMARVGGKGARVAFTFGDLAFDPDSASSVVHAAGFSSFEEFHLGELWARHWPERGDPPPGLIVSRVGTAVV